MGKHKQPIIKVGTPCAKGRRAQINLIEELMKLCVSVMTAVGLGLTCTALADNYNDLAAKGYRWVTVNGPYACGTEQDVRRLVGPHTDEEIDLARIVG